MDGRGRGYDEDADTGEGICNTSYVTLLASQSAQEKVFALVSAVSFLGNTTSARLISLRFCTKRHIYLSQWTNQSTRPVGTDSPAGPCPW